MTEKSPQSMPKPHPVVRYLDETETLPCPYGDTTRIVTGGEAAAEIANVHRVRVTKGARHFHPGYNEVYYVLAGQGRIVFDDAEHELRPGAVVVIPALVPHEVLAADEDQPLDFIIFGTPGMPVSDPRFTPTR